MIPVGADEYATAAMTSSWKGVPIGAPANGILDLPAPQVAAMMNAAAIAKPE